MQAFPPDTRYFTPAEANDSLAAAVEIARELAERATEAQLMSRLSSTNPSRAQQEAMGKRAEELERQAEDLLVRLRATGVHLKGISPLLLDFPALHNGQEAYLCWRDGDGEAITWWHPIHTGIAGRAPIDYRKLGDWEWCN